MPEIQLTSGEPVPEDRSHTKLLPDGQQQGYVVLSETERAKGFVKPVRKSYIHDTCGCLTSMALSLAETYARNPRFYSGTFCASCHAHFPLSEFHWCDGEPMEPSEQDAWAEGEKLRRRALQEARIKDLERQLEEARAGGDDAKD